MAASGCWPRCSVNFRFSQNCSPIAPTPDQSSILRSAKSCPTSKPKSSDAPIVPKGSCRYPSVGSSNVQALGESQSQRSRFPQTRFHPPHVAKAMQSLMKSPDGLLGPLSGVGFYPELIGFSTVFPLQSRASTPDKNTLTAGRQPDAFDPKTNRVQLKRSETACEYLRPYRKTGYLSTPFRPIQTVVPSVLSRVENASA